MNTYLPWNSIPVLWEDANQTWSEAWYVSDVPPIEVPVVDTGGYNLAMESIWGVWNSNQQKKRKKRKIELTCVIGGVHFSQEHDFNESEKEVSFDLERIGIEADHGPKNIQLEINQIL
jgi:hypothetical protein